MAPEHATDTPARVLLVGHCGFDSGRLERLALTAFPNTRIQSIHRETALEPLASNTLLLVNRVLDGSFQAADGIDLIGQYAPQGAVWLLISNFPQAQADAQAAGAQNGFGKADTEDVAIAALQAAWRNGRR